MNNSRGEGRREFDARWCEPPPLHRLYSGLLVKPEDAKGFFVSPFAVTSQDLLFRCWEQFLTVQAEVTKNSLFLPATSATQTHLQRVAFFKTRKTCYERTNTVLTHARLSRARWKRRGTHKRTVAEVFNLRRAPSLLITKIRLSGLEGASSPCLWRREAELQLTVSEPFSCLFVCLFTVDCPDAFLLGHIFRLFAVVLWSGSASNYYLMWTNMKMSCQQM